MLGECTRARFFDKLIEITNSAGDSAFMPKVDKALFWLRTFGKFCLLAVLFCFRRTERYVPYVRIPWGKPLAGSTASSGVSDTFQRFGALVSVGHGFLVIDARSLCLFRSTRG